MFVQECMEIYRLFVHIYVKILDFTGSLIYRLIGFNYNRHKRYLFETSG